MYTYEYSEDRHGNVLLERTGNSRYRNIFIQGEDAQELVKELDRCEDQEQLDYIIGEYFDCIDEEEEVQA